MIADRLGTVPLVLQLPIGAEATFIGVIDLVAMKAIVWRDETLGAEFTVEDIPAARRKEAEAARERVIEAAVEHDDAVMEAYLEGRSPDQAALRACIRRGTLAGAFVPVLCGAAFKNKGVQLLLDAIVDYLPSPTDVSSMTAVKAGSDEIVERRSDDDDPFAALAFKIMSDPFVGTLTFIRIYSGVVDSGSQILNSVKGKRERVGRMVLMHANDREEVKQGRAGDIIALAGLKDTTTGDTLCSLAAPVILEQIEFPEPVIEVAVEPKTKGDQDKMGTALARLAAEDPSFQVTIDPESGQTVIKGMGELHLEVLVDRMKREFQVAANVGAPQVAYRETISRPAEVDYIHRKQTGGAGQFARVKVRFEPLAAGSGLNIESAVRGGSVPREFIPAVEKGLRNAAEAGILSGYPVTDLKATLYDGDSHDVDSSALAFEIAARSAFREGTQKASPRLLEPIMRVEVVSPKEYMGEIVGDLNSRRGHISGMDQRGNARVITAAVPLATMFGYVNSLRSASQGRAQFTMHFDHYAEAPHQVSEDVRTRMVV
jgi:elongation factor G